VPTAIIRRVAKGGQGFRDTDIAYFEKVLIAAYNGGPVRQLAHCAAHRLFGRRRDPHSVADGNIAYFTMLYIARQAAAQQLATDTLNACDAGTRRATH
jgi:hypothetical protein